MSARFEVHPRRSRESYPGDEFGDDGYGSCEPEVFAIIESDWGYYLDRKDWFSITSHLHANVS